MPENKKNEIFSKYLVNKKAFNINSELLIVGISEIYSTKSSRTINSLNYDIQF